MLLVAAAQHQVVLSGFRVRVDPEYAVGRGEEAQDDLHQENVYNLLVSSFLDTGVLCACANRIFHNLGLMSGIHDYSSDPLGVPEGRSTKQNLVSSEGAHLSLVLELPFELIEQVIWLFARNFSVNLGDKLICGAAFEGGLAGLLQLEVSLSVEVLGLNIANSLRSGRG